MEAESEFEAAEHFLPLIPLSPVSFCHSPTKRCRKSRARSCRASRGRSPGDAALDAKRHASDAVSTNTPPGAYRSLGREAYSRINCQAGRGGTSGFADGGDRILARQRRFVLGNPKIRRLGLGPFRIRDGVSFARRIWTARASTAAPTLRGRAHGPQACTARAALRRADFRRVSARQARLESRLANLSGMRGDARRPAELLLVVWTRLGREGVGAVVSGRMPRRGV